MNSPKSNFKTLVGETELHVNILQVLVSRKTAMDNAHVKAEAELRKRMIEAGANFMEYTSVPSSTPYEARISWQARFYYCSPTPEVDHVYFVKKP